MPRKENKCYHVVQYCFYFVFFISEHTIKVPTEAPNAQGFGILGITIMAVTGCMMLILDIPSLKDAAVQLYTTLKAFFKGNK